MRYIHVLTLLIISGCGNSSSDSESHHKVVDVMMMAIKSQACEKYDRDTCQRDIDLAYAECKKQYKDRWERYVENGSSDDQEYMSYMDLVFVCVAEHKSAKKYFPISN